MAVQGASGAFAKGSVQSGGDAQGAGGTQCRFNQASAIHSGLVLSRREEAGSAVGEALSDSDQLGQRQEAGEGAVGANERNSG